MLFNLTVLDDLNMKDYDSKDERIFLKSHGANSLTKGEVVSLVKTLGDDFADYFEGADQATKDLIASL